MRASNRGSTVAFWLTLPAAIFVLGLLGVVMATPLGVALWWPAAGLSVWFALRTPQHARPYAIAAIFAVTTLANLATGRELVVSVIYGLANALEVTVVVLVLSRPGKPFVLRRLIDALWFVIAALIGATALGVIVGLTGALLLGTDYLATATMTGASHTSAILLIAPFAVLPPRVVDPASWIEVAVHSALVAVAILVAFHPMATLPLGFLIFAVLSWGALRFPLRVALVQSLVTAVAVLIFTLMGYGYLADDDLTPTESAISTVIFLGAIGLFTVLLASARYESRVNALVALRAAQSQTESERERNAALAERLELDRQREDFVATTSHELRTPITSIIGYTHLLADADLAPAEQGWVKVIERNATRLGSLVDDLLSLSRARRRPRVAVTATLHVRDLFDDAQTTHRPLADARSVDLDAVLHDHLTVEADHGDATRALFNLVSNAVKFTPPGGSVTMRAERVEDMVEITVIDTGPGMPPEVLSHAFERFYRAPDAATGNTPGTGLGLAITAELAQRNGGAVRLASDPGEGLRATLTLPATPDELES